MKKYFNIQCNVANDKLKSEVLDSILINLKQVIESTFLPVYFQYYIFLKLLQLYVQTN